MADSVVGSERVRDERVESCITKRSGVRGVTYRVKVELPPDPVTGRIHTKSDSFRTLTEARRAKNEWKRDADQGIAVPSSRMTMAVLIEEWARAHRPNVTAKTWVDDYQHTIDLLVLHIGTTLVQQVRHGTIQGLYGPLRDAGKSGDAIHRVHKRLKQVFDHALSSRIIAISPMRDIRAPRHEVAEAVILTPPQMLRFLTFAGEDGYNPLWLVFMQTGLRRGEALGLKWSSINFERATASIVAEVGTVGNTAVHLNHLKTPASRRTIPLFPETVAALRAHRARQNARRLQLGEAWQAGDFVFTARDGAMLDPHNVAGNLPAIIRRANRGIEPSDPCFLPAFSIHDLRHLHASCLIHDGWTIARIARHLGHANPSITMNTHAHIFEATEAENETITTPASLSFAVGE